MSTHDVCFPGEIRKILCGYPLLSVAMPVFKVHTVWCIVAISMASAFMELY